MVLAVCGVSVAFGAVEVGDSPSSSPTLISVSKTAPRVRAPAKKSEGARSDKLSWPLRGDITGQFGESRGGHIHAGIDIPMPAGTPIKAASAGRVLSAESESGYGNYICIAHLKLSTCYAHLQSFRTKQGEKVRRGELIGYVGNTGNSGAIHLHFEVRRGTRQWGEPIDPLKHLPGA